MNPKGIFGSISLAVIESTVQLMSIYFNSVT